MQIFIILALSYSMVVSRSNFNIKAMVTILNIVENWPNMAGTHEACRKLINKLVPIDLLDVMLPQKSIGGGGA